MKFNEVFCFLPQKIFEDLLEILERKSHLIVNLISLLKKVLIIYYKMEILQAQK